MVDFNEGCEKHLTISIVGIDDSICCRNLWKEINNVLADESKIFETYYKWEFDLWKGNKSL